MLLSLLILMLPMGASAGKNRLQQDGKQLAPPYSITKACIDTPREQLSCGMLLVLGGILDKEQGLQILECAARNGDKIAIAALYSMHASGSHGVPKDTERAEYWAKLGGIATPHNQAGRGYTPSKDMGRQNTVRSRADTTLSPCGHDDAQLNTLERKAVAGDKTAGDLLFDLYIKGRYTPCPEVTAALIKRGLLTKASIGEE
jgi:hypothetical protein